MGGGGTQKQSSEQTTTTSLPQNQQTNVDQLLSGALDFYQSGGREFFPGQTVAGYNPNQTGGQNNLLNYAGGSGQDFVDQAISGNQFFMNPENIMNPNNIPGFQGSVDDLTRGFTQNLTENILPSVRSGGTSSGQFGGSASGIGEALSVERSNAGLSDSLSGLYGDAYAQGLNSFNQAQNRAPALFGLGAAPGQLQAGIGDAQQQQQQREINGERERFEFGENEQVFIQELLQQITGGAGQFGGTVTSTGESTTKGGGGGALQGIGGLLSIGTMLSGLGGGGSKGGGETVLGSGGGGGNPGGITFPN